jgi:predicted O-linked N-acetylglucosamine transferase (SPINDLY family)
VEKPVIQIYNKAMTDTLSEPLKQAVALHQAGKFTEAAALCSAIVCAHPDQVEAFHLLALVQSELGRFEESLTTYDKVLAIKPDIPEALSNRGNTLNGLERFEEALESYDKAIMIRPNYVNALNNRGVTLHRLNRFKEALASYDKVLAIKADHAEALSNRGMSLKSLDRFEEALESYDKALAIKPNYAEALYNRGNALQAINHWQEAVHSYRGALAIRPDYAAAKFALCMAELPMLYVDEPEIATRRAAYKRAITAFCDEINGITKRIELANAVGSHQPFHLPYQGYNDRDLQARYGALVCRIMADRYPKAPLSSPPGPDDPLKVGIVTGFFRDHTVWKILVKGWVSQLGHPQFRVFGYHTRIEQDGETRIAGATCDRFVQGPLSIDRWRQTILSDAPHVLLYPDIGMDPTSAALAAQRLAPVQCISWGHPETSGFPSIDYFLSSDLMEPADGQNQYTERLVRLPNLSVYYDPQITRPARLRRPDLGLRSTSTVFWCGQSVFKYLPQYDEVFARIAREAGDCQFAFIEHQNSTKVTALFKQRLERAFAAVGLRANDYCVVLPRLDTDNFIAAIGLCDVVLDSIGWSGFNSTLEGLAHGAPIVTMTGRLMRSRHTMAVLQMMDVTETITETIDDYISVAVRLARDVPWRMMLKERMSSYKDRIYRDRTVIVALQEFLNRVARQHISVNSI